MVRNITRRTLTEEQRVRYNRFVADTNPSDNQQIEYLRTHFPNLLLAQIFQLFEIQNSRRHQHQINFENLIRSVRIRNTRINRTHRMNAANQNPNPQQNAAGNPPANPGNNPPGGNQGVNPVGNAPPVAPPVLAAQPPQLIFVDDPFKGRINPGTSEGAKTFGWGVLVRTVQVDAHTQKNILKDHKDISEADIKRQAYKTWGNHAADFLTPVPDTYDLEHIDPAQIPAHREIFFRRVRSRMIAKRIVAYLKTADYEVLKNKAQQFTWSGQGEEEIDGPTILWILLQICNPSTRVGVAELKED